MKIITIISFLSLLTFLPTDTQVENKLPESNLETINVDPQFVEFLSLFDKTALPFEVGLDDFDKYQDQKQPAKLMKSKKKRQAPNNDQQLLRTFISDYNFMSRMGPPSILPVARFYPNEKTIAIVYIPYRAFGNSTDLLFQMATFDLEGKQLKNKLQTENIYFRLGHKTNYDNQAQTFKISKNGQIERTTYKTIRKKKVKKAGINNNAITDYVLEQTEVFKIDNNGLVTVVENGKSIDRVSIE
ncbi:MAG: hypothetical protein AB8F74_08805 [Saprospiraceae bacterium]